MSEEKTIRINKVLRELNISLDRAVEHLKEKGHEIEARPTAKISTVEYQVLLDEFQTDMSKKVASIEVGEEQRKEKEALLQQIEKEQEEKKAFKEKEPTVIRGKAMLSGPKKVGRLI
jgi:translation initiation factor IF-2